ncbi:unnamed protein product [Didymodactylos carnosus]|uniref:non-specific serine/threonine protein kinase n=1 Tax=Didymodactylos carnosus TaxID=1234261 RepID=A0A814QZ38_9BILA|nr:unnamed protein product [Didymodactylos carnosus]CAF1126278.1 unnamed protein product [Didymodactylos carnosus]CAF3699950.1 unnamed protein product [Didymodactylos carnosus]CAF3889810.1 unnamed protein product [Didymodactylos carnosus]
METAPVAYSNVELICQGAEARLYRCLYFGRCSIIKERFIKTYRHPELDRTITSQRLRNEVRLLTRAKQLGIHTPSIYHIDLDKRLIVMEELVKCKTVKQTIDEYITNDDRQNLEKLAREIGHIIARLHESQIVHGDLTTSNMLLIPPYNNPEQDLYLIDFGLSSFVSSKQQILENIAVDLYVLERAVICTHEKAKNFFQNILTSYRQAIKDEKQREQIIKKYDEVRMRGRKRSMVG